MHAQPVPWLSPEAYLEIERRAEGKSEYFDGEMFAMSGGSREHSLIATNILSELRTQLKKRPCQVFTSDLRLKVDASGLYTYPDVTVACGELQFDDVHRDTLLNPILHH